MGILEGWDGFLNQAELVDTEVSRSDKRVGGREFDVGGPPQGSFKVQRGWIGGVADICDQQTFSFEVDEESLVLYADQTHVVCPCGLRKQLCKGVFGEIIDHQCVALVRPTNLVGFHVVPIAVSVDIECFTIEDEVEQLPTGEFTQCQQLCARFCIENFEEIKSRNVLVSVIGLIGRCLWLEVTDVRSVLCQESDLSVGIECFDQTTGDVDLCADFPCTVFQGPQLGVVTIDAILHIVGFFVGDFLSVDEEEVLVVERNEMEVFSVLGCKRIFFELQLVGIAKVQEEELGCIGTVCGIVFVTNQRQALIGC